MIVLCFPVTIGTHYAKKINFDNYYQTINDCIDWQKNKYPNLQISYQDIILGNVEKLNKFIESNTDAGIINDKYYRQKV